MKHWWNRHSGLNLGGYGKEEIEDLTGCIPLLLNECVVNEKIDLSPLKKLGNIARVFTAEIRRKTKIDDHQDLWDMYVHSIILSYSI